MKIERTTPFSFNSTHPDWPMWDHCKNCNQEMKRHKNKDNVCDECKSLVSGGQK